MLEIRIDQSHCNYWLDKALKAAGWQVLFKDAGRVSRGGVGNQGMCLKAFEENGLHIPDIVAVSPGTALLVEIDGAYSKVEESLRSYRRHARLILTALWEMIPVGVGGAGPVLKLGYCKTGRSKDSSLGDVLLKVGAAHLDLLVTFAAPKDAKLSWVIFS